jgi:hypothetical protein
MPGVCAVHAVMLGGESLLGSVPNLLKLLSEFAIFTPPAIML